MSDFAYVIGTMRTELDDLKTEIHLLKQQQEGADCIIQEQGHALRNTTMILERIVNMLGTTLEETEEGA